MSGITQGFVVSHKQRNISRFSSDQVTRNNTSTKVSVRMWSNHVTFPFPCVAPQSDEVMVFVVVEWCANLNKRSSLFTLFSRIHYNLPYAIFPRSFCWISSSGVA